MSDVNPTGSSPPPPQNGGKTNSDPPGGLAGSDPTAPDPGGSFNNLKTWLGPDGYKAFMDSICKGIVSDIGKRKEVEEKVAKQLKAAETGEDMNDV